MASFKKLGTDNWQVSFYCKDYLGNNKKYKKSGFRTKSLANEYANDFITKMNGSSEVMLFTVIDEYLEYAKDKLKFNTFRNYQSVKSNIISKAQNIKLYSVDEKYIFELLEKFNSTPSSKKLIKILLSLIFDYSKIHYNIKINPIKNLVYKKTVKEKEVKLKEKEIWTLEEFKVFISKLDSIYTNYSTVKRYNLIYKLLYFTGMRIGELCGLQKKDIDTINKTININKTRLTNGGINSPKTISGKRIIQIHTSLNNELEEYLKTIPDVENGFLFPSIYSIQSMFRTALSKTDLPKMTLHGFRHSHVSFLISKGVDIVEISKRLGHSNPNITLSIYSHFYKDKDNTIVDILENL